MKKFIFMLCMIVVIWSPLGFSENEDDDFRNPDWDNRLPEGKLGKVTKDWLRTQRRKLGVGPNVPLKFETISSYRNGEGRITFRFKAYVRGIPVVAKHIVVHIDEVTRDVLGMRGRLNLEGLADIRPIINRGDAAARVAQHGLVLTDIVDDAELVFLTKPNNVSVLSWQVEVKYGDGSAAEHDFMFFDAMTGDLNARHAQVHRIRNRLTYDADNGPIEDNLTVQRTEDSEDMNMICLDDAHNNVGVVYDYFKSEHSRDSYDNAGADIKSYVRTLFDAKQVKECGPDDIPEEDGKCIEDVVTRNGASWNGYYKRLSYGEGQDGKNCWTPMDIVAHEYTHAITQHSAQLIYQDESGALNESWSDAFGAVLEAHDNGGIDLYTWYMGENLYPGRTKALRSMADPVWDTRSKDHYNDMYTGTDDRGGVHRNSGIPNLAFKLLSVGEKHPRGKTPNITVTGIGINKAADIWYDALQCYMDPNETMHEARASTLLSTFDNYNHEELSQVANAWAAVGVGDAAKPSSHACLPGNFDQSQSTISDIYIAYYGRPADAGGMSFWNRKLIEYNGDLNAIMAWFADSAEFTRRFGGLNNTELVTNIYQQLFNRDPDAGGLNFYVNSLNAGTRTLESIALDILNGSSGGDLTVLNNRREVAGDYHRYAVSTGVSLLEPQLSKLMASITLDHQTAQSACADSLLLSEYTKPIEPK